MGRGCRSGAVLCWPPAPSIPRAARRRSWVTAAGVLGRLAPENTLSAYRAAIALGIELVETDLRPTADEVLVNLHDPAVDRTTRGSGMARMSLAQLRALRVRAEGFPDHLFCERVPTLAEVLRTCRGRVVVSLDAHKTDRVAFWVAAIRDADALDRVHFNTSRVDRIDRALRLEPRPHFQFRPRELANIDRPVDHFVPHLPVIVEVSGALAAAAVRVHAHRTRLLTPVLAEDIAATLQGDLAGYGRIFAAGVDLVQSDRPQLVLAYLRQRSLRL